MSWLRRGKRTTWKPVPRQRLWLPWRPRLARPGTWARIRRRRPVPEEVISTDEDLRRP